MNVSIKPDDVRRFRALFDGLPRVYGSYIIGDDEPDERGKRSGKAVTIRQPVTDELIRKHLAGEQSIGIVPIRDDATARFGAIDIDEYAGLDHAAISQLLFKENLSLITCQSKSKGAHLFLFTSEPVPAVAIRKKLTELAAMLGHGGCEIFPKQNKLAENECGGWINLPFFADTRHAVVPNGDVLTLAQFLDLAEQSRVDKKFFGKAVTNSVFPEGPPCLNHLVTIGVPAGTRNDALFALGTYAKRAHPGNWKAEIENYNRGMLNPPLDSPEVMTIIKSLDKKDYAYACLKSPLVQHCDKALCKTRRYGVGSAGGTFPVLGPLVKFDSKPPRYLWEVDGARVPLDTDQIMNYWQFKRACFQELNKVLPDLKQKDWQPLLSQAMEQLQVEPVEDVSPEAVFWNHLESFCERWSAMADSSWDQVRRGNAFTIQGRTYFRMVDLQRWLDSNKFRACSPQEVGAILKQRGATSEQRKLDGRNVRLWSVPAFSGVSDTCPEPGVF